MAENVFLKECNVKKTNQYDALDFLESFNLGTPLYLFREPEDNKETVFLYYEENDKDNKGDKNRYHKIGIISEEDEDPIDKFLKARQTGTKINEQDINELLLECKVCSIDTNADEDKRIKVAIFIKKSKVCSIDTNADEDKRIKVAIFIKKKVINKRNWRHKYRGHNYLEHKLAYQMMHNRNAK